MRIPYENVLKKRREHDLKPGVNRKCGAFGVKLLIK